MVSQGKRPPVRRKPETDRVRWWEAGIAAVLALLALESWVMHGTEGEGGEGRPRDGSDGGRSR